MIGEDFIALAGRLAAASHGDEAVHRTAVSRAYYGAFHVVKRFFEELGLQVRRDHGDFQRSLMQSGHPRATLAGRYRNDLHSSRIKADYDLANHEATELGFARECIEVASDIRSILQHLGADDRSLIKAGIEGYRNRIAPASPKES